MNGFLGPEVLKLAFDLVLHSLPLAAGALLFLAFSGAFEQN